MPNLENIQVNKDLIFYIFRNYSVLSTKKKKKIGSPSRVNRMVKSEFSEV